MREYVHVISFREIDIEDFTLYKFFIKQYKYFVYKYFV